MATERQVLLQHYVQAKASKRKKRPPYRWGRVRWDTTPFGSPSGSSGYDSKGKKR